MSQTASGAHEDTPPAPDAVRNENGHKSYNGEGDEPPSKRRRLSGSVPQRRKPESPPWKKMAAEGPSSFTQDGVRKSGRTNQIPLELQPQSDKRQTRAAIHRTYAAKSKHGSISGNANGSGPSLRTRDVASSNGGPRKSNSVNQSNTQPSKPPVQPVNSGKRSQQKAVPNDPSRTPIRSHRTSSTPKDTQSISAVKTRRSGHPNDVVRDDEARHYSKSNLPHSDSPRSRLSRIKFRVKPAVLPLTHPKQTYEEPKKFSELHEFLEQGPDLLVEHGGLLHPDDGPVYTSELITRDARKILQLEDAAEPGGSLGPEQCSLYQPEEQEYPPDQYAHRDHLNRAAIGFRKLMLMEQNRHQSTAKRLAELCRDEWYRRQPKSSQDLEAEKANVTEGRYKLVIKSLQGTWDNVKAEVNHRRILEWEAREQARVRKALNEAVDISTQKLQARRAHMDSEVSTDDDDDEEDDGHSSIEEHSTSGSADKDDNVSSSGSDSEEEAPKVDATGDESLTVEQLREKYESLPSLNAASVINNRLTTDPSRFPSGPLQPNTSDVFDDSDESIDMDDDMGSSEGDADSPDGSEIDNDNEYESDESGSDDAGASSLLGFFACSELNSLELAQGNSLAPTATKTDAELGEEDEVSLIPEIIDREPLTDKTLINSIQHGDDHSKYGSLPTEQFREAKAPSPDRSSQPTPRTTETKPSETDSASSVELHQNSRQATQSARPQPPNQLKTPIPSLLRGTLRQYQHYGLDWLAGLYANNTNGILADEMGLGKTIQTIALLAHLACEHEVWGPHLVIVPTSVMLNWEMEFKKWCPGFKILTYYGTQEERKRKRLGWKSEDAWNVCITSYQLVIQDQQVFKRRRWHYMILDEAHNIKNFQSQRWQTMLTFNTRARLLLTGTPLQNNLTELWSLLYFLMPSDGSEQGVGGFANLKEFQDWFKKPSEQILEHGREKMDDESRAIISKLHKVLRPYLLRRMKADVEKQMPAKYEHVEFCRFSKRQRELYDNFLSRDDTRGTLASGNYLSIINCLMQLRKVCNHPDLFLDRPILTSFPMERSVVADFEIKDLIVRRRLLRADPMAKASLDFLNLVPTNHETYSASISDRSAIYTAQRLIMSMREAQRARAQQALTHLDPSTVKSNLTYLESASRWGRFEELQHCVYLNALRRQKRPIYGSQLIELLTLGVHERPLLPRPSQRNKLLGWLESASPRLAAMVPTTSSRSQSLNLTIQKFACVTPPVVARVMTSLLLTPKLMNALQFSEPAHGGDPFHEARVRLSVQFPDKRLLQYDCGKLQTLDKLLRRLQAGGHRALIFTQMTKVLDILEQFLNIHGHKYLRLDGATKIEQRQILTDRFNNDTRILAFILSSRSGGLGINLTGADTVIFYDLDWNPAMDKQCQDRCHRIGQTRDVHIYRLVSEHTIEANILRKANQKRMLDDVVIQEGEFTTDYFNKMSVRDVLGEESALLDGDAVANAAMDRVLRGPEDTDVRHVLAQAEDREDFAAARVAEREVIQTDAADFDENVVTASATPADPETPQDTITPVADETSALDTIGNIDIDREINAWGRPILSVDDYMLLVMTTELKNAPMDFPMEKSKSKRGKDRRHSHRVR